MHRTGLAVFAEVLRELFSEVRIAKQRLSSRKITHLHHDSASLGYVACSVVCSRSATTQRGKATMGGERPNARKTGRKRGHQNADLVAFEANYRAVILLSVGRRNDRLW